MPTSGALMSPLSPDRRLGLNLHHPARLRLLSIRPVVNHGGPRSSASGSRVRHLPGAHENPFGRWTGELLNMFRTAYIESHSSLPSSHPDGRYVKGSGGPTSATLGGI